MQASPHATNAVVVSESMFGNTRAIADAVAAVLSEHVGRVDVFDAAHAPTRLAGVDVLVVGAPTHAFSMSRPSTRTSARDQGAPTWEGPGVREWLDALERPPASLVAATFDTRIKKPFLPGSAARAMARRLRRLGVRVVPPVSFAVGGTPGPLLDGELERARRWAASLPVPERQPVNLT